MDIEFHYWLTALIAERAGFDKDEVRTIAFSSQYVDDNDVRITVLDHSTNAKYQSYISQTMDITKPKRELMRIYPIFHFVPGEPAAETARRRDGKMHILTTTPNSETANHFIDAAFKSGPEYRLHRIGIATHAFVDTWAHQNFVGWFDDYNAMGKILPNIGHADATHKPDLVGLKWKDDRLVDAEVDNNGRFLSAAKKLFEKYCDYLVGQHRYESEQRPDWYLLEKELREIMNSAGEKKSENSKNQEERKERNYKTSLNWLGEYDEWKWWNAAIETNVKGLNDLKGGILSHLPKMLQDEYYWKEDVDKENMDWYKFQQALRDHQVYGMELIAPIYRQMNVDLRSV